MEMATNGALPSKVQRNLKGFSTVLKSAACEWFLIFLLFIDAALSYLLTRFARYCELQIPCILCSRLDHVFGNEKPGFYWNLLCSNHRSEISLLISCNIHGKLVDGRGMCENCLSSHIEENKSNSDTQRPFVGKLGFDPAGFGNCGFQSSFFNMDLTPSKCTSLCLCCNKPWIPRPNAQRFLPLKSTGIALANPNIPLSHRLSHQNGLKKIRDKFSAPAATHLVGKTGFDPLSHVGYTELKITSESESEVPFSDDEDNDSIVSDMNENKKESLVHCAPETPPKRLCNNLATTKQPDANEPCNVTCSDPDVPSENDVCEHKEQLADQKTNPSVLPELISLDDIPPSSCFVEVPSFSASLLSDLISLVDTPPKIDVTEVALETSSEKLADVIETSKNENISINKNYEILKLISTSTGVGFKTDEAVDDTAVVNSTDEDLSALHKSPVCGEEKGASVFVTKQPILKCNNRVNEDPKSLPVQNSSGQGIHLSSNNLSPKLQGHNVELQRNNESNSDEFQNLQNLVFMERSESAGLESLDGISVNETESENLVDRLKRQVEYDRKCMNALYKELEEERSASAIAANQAMAMITRLQEEKAALHMEALQYLRMMEEQAEYDVDALEKANDLLAEKEKELQDLEAELEYYRLNFTDETLIENVPEASINLKKEHVSVENTSTSSIKDDLKFSLKTMFPETSKLNDNPIVISAWSEFEDEKLYISECLQILERKLNRFAHHGTSPYISDGEYFDKAADGGQHQQEFLDEKDKQVICQVEGNDLPVQKVSSVSNGSASSQEWLNTSITRAQGVSEGNGLMVSNGQNGSEDCGETGLAGLQNEISDLNERLEALEADYNFLKHSLNSLQNGNEGMLFIEEILHQLRELRELGIRSRNMSVS
ncbi:probable myosin-binding protein 4 [Durio zibethinus]|uniref:Probable myosin-binding protein 4 n=1 Tax=Durio zibethinus TaxID=66656 RepID=A0A6P5XK18_DURZI|nr:probable myosin-binding protein 4 [Durio zibethinus]XP_022728232.1 probable myosin-binding protein 4 [Durio zibethinus]XP_022728233.1 probable myosin-binding protein 4 [Durio zibethinus]